MRPRQRCTACRGRTAWSSSRRARANGSWTERMACTARVFGYACALWFLAGCASDGSTPVSPDGATETEAALLDDVQQRTFRFFQETTNAVNGLVPDRWPTPSFSSVAAVGFGLTANIVGVERGWITRASA